MCGLVSGPQNKRSVGSQGELFITFIITLREHLLDRSMNMKKGKTTETFLRFINWPIINKAWINCKIKIWNLLPECQNPRFNANLKINFSQILENKEFESEKGG